MDANELRARAAQGQRALQLCRSQQLGARPLAADRDSGAAPDHLGMADVPLVIGDHQSDLEAEGFLQPFEGRHRIAVEGCGRDRRGFIGHCVVSLRKLSNISAIEKLNRQAPGVRPPGRLPTPRRRRWT